MRLKEFIATLPRGEYDGDEILKKFNDAVKAERTAYKRQWFKKTYVKKTEDEEEDQLD